MVKEWAVKIRGIGAPAYGAGHVCDRGGEEQELLFESESRHPQGRCQLSEASCEVAFQAIAGSRLRVAHTRLLCRRNTAEQSECTCFRAALWEDRPVSMVAFARPQLPFAQT